MKHWMRTHMGKVRSQNEDAALVAPPALFGVADGMGGHNAGEVASGLAVQTLRDTLPSKEVGEAALIEAFHKANEQIYQHAARHEECAGMGTTFSVLWLEAGHGLIGHVGDSRVYRFRDAQLQRLTADHSMVEEWVRKGLLTAEEALRHPYRNVITRALGSGDRIEVDMLSIELLPEDIFLICSDGLTNMVGDTELRTLLQSGASGFPMEDIADTLLERALDAGGKDNITFVLLQEKAEVEA